MLVGKLGQDALASLLGESSLVQELPARDVGEALKVDVVLLQLGETLLEPGAPVGDAFTGPAGVVVRGKELVQGLALALGLLLPEIRFKLLHDVAHAELVGASLVQGGAVCSLRR